MILRKLLLTTTIGLILGQAASGCSDDGDKSGGAAKYVTDYCAIMSKCCEVWGAKNDNGAQCNQVMGFFAMGTVDQTAANQCLASMQAAWEAGTLCEPGSAPNTQDDPCDRVFAGQTTQAPAGSTPAGGKCDTPSDCAAPAGGVARCDMLSSNGGTTEWYCQAVSPGKEGDACTMTVYSNGGTMGYSSADQKQPNVVGCKTTDGLFCEGTSKTCKKVSPVGSDCSGSSLCVEGSFCYNQVCTPNLKAGDACEKYVTTCETGLYCDESSKKCAALKHIGDPCTEAGECTGMECRDDGTCGPGLAALAGMMMCQM